MISTSAHSLMICVRACVCVERAQLSSVPVTNLAGRVTPYTSRDQYMTVTYKANQRLRIHPSYHLRL